MDQKLSHAAVRYHLTSGADRCDGCRFYLGHACSRVVGPIMPSGWCRLFSRARKGKPNMPLKSRFAHMHRAGLISNAQLKAFMKVLGNDRIQDNSTVAGAVKSGHINTGRPWPAASSVRKSNDLRSWSKQRAARVRPTGGYYGGGSRNA
jgi:hypothetical protein